MFFRREKKKAAPTIKEETKAAETVEKTFYWHTPRVTTTEYFQDMEKQAHVLIGGMTGAGKSVALNGFMINLLSKAPSEAEFILIDPKGVELLDYAELPHTICHAYEIEDIAKALKLAFHIMQSRFNDMIERHEKKTSEGDIYVIIDEYADIKYCADKQLQKQMINYITRIAAKGRASKVHLVLCTQRPTRDVIDGMIKANFTTTLALRTEDAQDSYNLIKESGCEDLQTGQAYYKSPSYREIEGVLVPFVSDEEIQRVVTHWLKQI